jgi:GNAT superfamily N-acetyltransferase
MTVDESPTIRQAADASEVRAAAELIALSFDRLAANRYLVPEASDRLPVMADFFHILVEYAADGNGEVSRTEDGSAVAVWFDRTREMPEMVDYEQRLKGATGPYLDRFSALDELLESHHPEQEHWHLAFLAVHPDRWGQGLGSALMRQTHTRLDQSGVPAYLEATNHDNHRVYLRHGYQDMDPASIHLPDGTPFYRMWRPATVAAPQPLG